MDVKIDRDSAIPARQQIRAAIVRQIASGGLGVGMPLPSVRDLADRAGIAPMTVTRAYADLKQAGLIEARTGAGTFVSESALSRLGTTGRAVGIWQIIDDLIAEAAAHGIEVADLLSLVAARDLAAKSEPRIVMVGLFTEATRSYAACVAEQTAISIEPIALWDEAPEDAALTARLADADLILTFATLHDRLAALAPGREVISLRFIPAEQTRLALAALDPMARLVAVSRFEDFLPILTLGVRRFASHVQSVTPRMLDASDLPALLKTADVVVMSSGAESAARAARPGAALIEYLHVPDPGDIGRLVLPRLGFATPDARKEAS
ncbi:GntR family transcriptional regulator [uncultured Jannaschia sp.]|uniref:GntR family transcriptional regulator n=1 Tax=uncultured Jannaschia sp. TaxID=293347 RepID=UPI00262B308E|nr:GntR family transcriptional regulator [uncultured Jannaschia sp.]